MLSLLLLVSLDPALAEDTYGSEPRELLFVDAFDVFDTIEQEIVVPANSPVAVRLYIESDGGYTAAIEADSDVWWPDPLSHGILGRPAGGYVELVTDITIGADLFIDLSDFDELGLGIVTVPVWSDGLYTEDERVFDGLLLDGSLPADLAIENFGEVIGPYETSFSVFSVVEVVFTVEAVPRIQMSLAGSRIESNDGYVTEVAFTEADVVAFAVPEHDPALLELVSTYYADLTAALDLVVVPGVKICAPVIGCPGFATFEIPVPVPLSSVAVERAFEPVLYDHPLPSMAELFSSYDFGEVALGSVTNVQVGVENVGLLELAGEVRLDGSPAFTVYPDGVFAMPEGADGFVLTFSPEEEGVHTGVLTLTTSDPANPVVEIPLLGKGLAPAPEVETPTQTLSVDGCTCASGASSAMWTALFPALLLIRRRGSAART